MWVIHNPKPCSFLVMKKLISWKCSMLLCLQSTYEDLHSNPSTTKQKMRREGGKEGKRKEGKRKEGKRGGKKEIRKETSKYSVPNILDFPPYIKTPELFLSSGWYLCIAYQLLLSPSPNPLQSLITTSLLSVISVFLDTIHKIKGCLSFCLFGF